MINITTKQIAKERLIMARRLSKEEKQTYINNRDYLHYQLSEVQADLEDMSDEELIINRDVILQRINCCMEAILETDEDNL